MISEEEISEQIEDMELTDQPEEVALMAARSIAMAIGADAVAIGRLQAYAMGAAGQAGVIRMLELLEVEIRICLGLLGVTGYDGLDKSYLYHDASVTPPHVLSALPLLEEEEY